MKRTLQLALLLLSLSCAPTLRAQNVTVHGRVEVTGETKSSEKKHAPVPSTVVWLTPAPGSEEKIDPPAPANWNPKLVQKNKDFQPHLLVVPAGSTVAFPNHDPFFHNVFSLFEGKRFDLGLYEAGTTRMVRFDRPGISYIFCNIHPQMSAVVITMDTPLYSVLESNGLVNIPNVPPGRYVLHVWSVGIGPEVETPPTREVTIAENATSFGVIHVPPATGFAAHKNKYGREYDEPTPDSSIYKQH